MENYELTIVLGGKATPAKVKAAKEKIEKLVNVLKGKIGKIEDWGAKDLTFKIIKNDTGYFLFFPLELDKAAVKDLTQKLKMEGEVVRYLFIRKEK